MGIRDDQLGDVPNDLVPGEAPDTNEPPLEHPQFENFASDKDLVKKAGLFIDAKYKRHKDKREDYEDVWNEADVMWRCKKNASVLDTSEAQDTKKTQANTTSTLFYRQATTLAAQGYNVQFSKDEDYQYKPLWNPNVFTSAEDAKHQANQHNTLARWNKHVDDYEQKFIEVWNLAGKNSNVPLVCFWNRKKALRRIREPIFAEAQPVAEGEEPPMRQVIGWNFTEESKVVANHFSFKVVNLENFYADPNIGDLQDQQVIVMKDLVSISALYQGSRDGYYDGDQLEKITEQHLYLGENEEDTRQVRLDNAGTSDVDDTDTGQYQVFDVFAKLPIDEEGKWDIKENEPLWFWLTLVGNEISDSVCIRFQRNPDPDDEFPGVMAKYNPDESDMLYCVSNSQLLKSNYIESCTAKNQAIDNKTLINNKPIKEKIGEVMNPGPFRADKRFLVQEQDSIEEMQVADSTGSTLGTLQWLDSDGDRTVGTDKPITGEALGERTSATEAQNVFQQAQLPHNMRIKYFLNQTAGWHARKLVSYWRLYANPEQVVEITGEEPALEIKPAELYGDYDVTINIVDDFVNSAIALDSINTALQTIVPNFPDELDKRQLLLKFFELNKWSNPTELIRWDRSVDAERVARIELNQLLTGQALSPDPESDLKTKLRVMEPVRAALRGLEDQGGSRWTVQGVANLDRYIALSKLFLDQQQAQSQVFPGQTPALPENQTNGQAAGNALAGLQGARV